MIQDFTQGQDRIDLAAILGATDLLWGGTTPTPYGVWYGPVNTTTQVYVDLNGNTYRLRVQANGSYAFTTADFLGVASSGGGGTGPGGVNDTAAASEDNVLAASGNVLTNDSRHGSRGLRRPLRRHGRHGRQRTHGQLRFAHAERERQLQLRAQQRRRDVQASRPARPCRTRSPTR